MTVRMCFAVALSTAALLAGCSNTTTGEATKATGTTSREVDDYQDQDVDPADHVYAESDGHSGRATAGSL